GGDADRGRARHRRVRPGPPGPRRRPVGAARKVSQGLRGVGNRRVSDTPSSCTAPSYRGADRCLSAWSVLRAPCPFPSIWVIFMRKEVAKITYLYRSPEQHESNTNTTMRQT